MQKLYKFLGGLLENGLMLLAFSATFQYYPPLSTPMQQNWHYVVYTCVMAWVGSLIYHWWLHEKYNSAEYLPMLGATLATVSFAFSPLIPLKDPVAFTALYIVVILLTAIGWYSTRPRRPSFK